MWTNSRDLQGYLISHLNYGRQYLPINMGSIYMCKMSIYWIGDFDTIDTN